MSLIKSISGIRGTIGGIPADNLTPLDITKYAAAYGTWILQNRLPNTNKKARVVIGRDARISGPMVNAIVCATLNGLGIDVIDTGLSTTPTVEMAVVFEKADGGIIITASHNPKQWNALKLLNNKGEFLSAQAGALVLSIAEQDAFKFASVDELGSIITHKGSIEKHIEEILKLPLINIEAIRNANFSISIDCVNSSGGIVLPILLKKLGVNTIHELYTVPNGEFPHNPEPLPEHLTALSDKVIETKSQLGIVVDPDVDRLAFVCEDGTMFGEEYTLVAVADYILKHSQSKNTVSNLSSTRALRDVTEKHGGTYTASAVGEVNVVEQMKASNAVIGGEGNGGIILPELHYGRDALVGIALFLSHLALENKNMRKLRDSYPNYFISKNKIDVDPSVNLDILMTQIMEQYKAFPINTIDGVKIEFEKEWVHLRRSNTEPIIRIYAESENEKSADDLAQKIITSIKSILKN